MHLRDEQPKLIHYGMGQSDIEEIKNSEIELLQKIKQGQAKHFSLRRYAADGVVSMVLSSADGRKPNTRSAAVFYCVWDLANK